MSEIDDIVFEMGSLEKAVLKNTEALIALALEIAAVKEDQSKILEILHLVSNPTKENREKVNAIMDAYERYEFVRKLSKGN